MATDAANSCSGRSPGVFQSCRPKRFPKPEKWLSQSGSASNLFHKASFQSDSRKLLPKLPCKKAPQTPPPQKQMSCAAPQRCAHSCPPKLLPESFDSAHVFTKNVPKAILQNGFRWPQNCYAWPRKLFPKAASKSCFPKLLPQSKAVFAATVRQCYFNAAKFLPMSESCSSKHPCKAVAPKRLFPRTTLHTCSSQRLPKALQKFPLKLRFFKVAVKSCSPKLFPAMLHKDVPEAVFQCSCRKKILQSCFPKRAILQTCLPKRLPKVILRRGSRKMARDLLLEAAPRSWL